MTTEQMPALYTCPGEEHPIPRSVHLSRLAAFYPKCRDCKHRADTGNLPQQTLERLQSTERRIQRPTIFTKEGVRAIYLNELKRNQAAEIAGALASILWERTPLIGRIDQHDDHRKATPKGGPTVVVGYDERPSSPDIFTGVTTGLKRMGCHVVDIGLSTLPVFSFAVDHLQAAGGMFVTGSGCDPSWTGLDIVGHRGQPLSEGSGLEELEVRFRERYSRPTRQSGSHRIFQATIPYEAGLWKHFHALRPLKVCCACPVLLIRSVLTRLFEKLPCELELVEIPRRLRKLDDRKDPDIIRLGKTVRNNDADLGVLIDDDGQSCVFVDERGQLVDLCDITKIIAEEVRLVHPADPIVLPGSSDQDQETPPCYKKSEAIMISSEPTMAEFSQTMRDRNAVFGGGFSNRFWFRESYPACDAILATARILQALSRSDAKFSEVVTSRHI